MMDRHVTILGALYIASGLLMLLLALFLFVAIAGGGMLSQDATAIAITGTVATVLSGFFFLLSLPAMLVGVGLMRRRNWARIGAFILGALNILNIPIGTAIGIYTFWVLTRPEVEATFRSQMAPL